MNVFEKQNVILSKMVADYNKGVFKNSAVFKPYMDWKQSGKLNISQAQSWAMRDEAQSQLCDLYDRYPHAYQYMDSILDDDPWQMYKGYGEDKYMVSYLEGIDNELTNIHFFLTA